MMNQRITRVARSLRFSRFYSENSFEGQFLLELKRDITAAQKALKEDIKEAQTAQELRLKEAQIAQDSRLTAAHATQKADLITALKAQEDSLVIRLSGIFALIASTLLAGFSFLGGDILPPWRNKAESR